MPTHYIIRTFSSPPGCGHLKLWLETSADGENWLETDHKENNEQLNSESFTGINTVAGCGECRFIRLVNIGRNHNGSDCLEICAWQIFGSLVE
jgi:hypothetical protein